MKLLKSSVVKISGKEYAVKRSIRAYLTFEELSEHSIEDFQETLKEVVIFFYACFQSGGNKHSYDEFLDLIDDDPDCIKAFSDSMIEKSEKKEKAV
jgi:hypothetical protein